MSVMWLVRAGDVLKPADVESAAEFSRLPFAKPVRAEVKLPRNSAHHRLFWLLCTRIANAVGAEVETVSDILKIESGHCVIVGSAKYGEIRLPRSISFKAMDQTEFAKFFDRCLDVIVSNWGIARADVLAAVEDLIAPTERR